MCLLLKISISIYGSLAMIFIIWFKYIAKYNAFSMTKGLIIYIYNISIYFLNTLKILIYNL